MFDSIGWGEILVLALAALFIFGPERLPDLAKDAAAGLKKVRQAVTGVREQVNDSLGDDLAHLRDLDLRQYHPRTFIRNQLLGDEDEPLVRTGSTAASKVADAPSDADAMRRAKEAAIRPPAPEPVATRLTPPPFDSDAT